MFKKTMVLAMAVGIVAAMALPATAGAFWRDNGQPIKENDHVDFTGTSIKFESQVIGGGLGCQVTSTVELKAGQTTATALSFKAHPTSDTANCFGTGGLAFCQVHNLQPQQGIQWVIHTKSGTTSIDITHGAITSQVTGGFCPANHVEVKAGTVEGHTTQHLIETVQITGKAHVVANGVQQDQEAAVTGLLHLEGTPTYEI